MEAGSLNNFFSSSRPINWPPISGDRLLTIFCKDYIRAAVYAYEPALIDAFGDNIDVFIRKILAQDVGKSMPKLDQAGGPFEAQS